MEMARRQLFREIDVMDEWLGLGRPAVKRAAPWMIATFVLGSLFLAGQWVAWEQLVQQGFYYNSPDPSSHFFYLITGVHGLHRRRREMLGPFTVNQHRAALAERDDDRSGAPVQKPPARLARLPQVAVPGSSR